MNNMITGIQISPLNPLKGRIAPNLGQKKLATVAHLRGLGVNQYNINYFHKIKW